MGQPRAFVLSVFFLVSFLNNVCVMSTYYFYKHSFDKKLSVVEATPLLHTWCGRALREKLN